MKAMVSCMSLGELPITPGTANSSAWLLCLACIAFCRQLHAGPCNCWRDSCAQHLCVFCRLGPNPDNPNQQLIDEQGNPIDEFPHRTAKTAKRLPAGAEAGRDANPQPAHALASMGSSWSLGRGVPLLEGLRRRVQGLLQGPGQGQAHEA